MPTEELYGAYNFLLEIAGVTPDSKTIIGVPLSGPQSCFRSMNFCALRNASPRK
jgi:hypothetical protein